MRLYIRCIAAIRVNVRGLSADTESRSSPLQGSASFPRRDTHSEYIWLRCLHPQALSIMLCEHHTLRLPASGLWMSANRYRPAGNVPLRGVTLVFAHCTSGRTTSLFTPMTATYADLRLSDKEQWEPALTQVFELAAGSDPSHTVPIREAWALDAPNHGDSAVLNRDVLTNRPPFCALY